MSLVKELRASSKLFSPVQHRAADEIEKLQRERDIAVKALLEIAGAGSVGDVIVARNALCQIGEKS